MNIQPLTLSGNNVLLEPLSMQHLAGLVRVIEDGKLWEIPFTFVPSEEELPLFIAKAIHAQVTGDELAFAVIDERSDTIVGSTRFRHISTQHRKVEIGNTFIARQWQKSYVNTTAKFLMLQHAFEEWKCQRVEFLTDERNAVSRAAILRLGATEEGLLRQHMILPNGFVRDSVIYSVIDSEWAAVKAHLQNKLNRI